MANNQELTGRVITDIGAGYQFTKTLKLTVGANNLFDVYPAQLLLASHFRHPVSKSGTAIRLPRQVCIYEAVFNL